MLQLRELRLNNYSLFADETFKFQTGLTVVGGNNRVGKTLLLSALQPLLVGLAHGDSMPRGSHVELDARKVTASGKTDLRIVADTPKTRPDWQLLVNGSDVATHRKADARQLISRQIGFTEELFNASCHLVAGDRNLPLFAGTPATRMDWLTSVFNLLHRYTSMREMVDTRLRALDADTARLSALEEQLRDLPEEPDLDKLKLLKRKLRSLEDKVADATAARAKQQELDSLINQRRLLKQRRSKFNSKLELQEELNTLSRALAAVTKQQDKLAEYEADQRDYVRYKARRAKLLQALSKPPSDDLAAEIDQLAELNDKLRNMLTIAEATNDAVAARSRAIQQLKTMRQPELSESQAEKAEMSAQRTIDQVKHQLNKLGPTEGTCPECGAELNEKHVERVESRLRKEWKQAKQDLEAAQRAMSYYGLRKLAKFKGEPIDIPAVKKRLERIRQRGKALTALSELEVVKKPVEPKQVTKAPKDAIDSMTALRLDLSLLNSLGLNKFPSESKLKQRIDELKQELHGVDGSFADLYAQSQKVSERIQRIRSAQRHYNSVSENNDRLNEDIIGLRRRVNTLRPLKVLKDAFGRDGVLLIEVNDLIQQLLRELNRLVPLLINEKFRVDIVTGPRKLDVLVERNGSVGNLRTLSTSERRCWSLLFAAAMLRILPNHMLVDTIILDELEANMDAHSRAAYTSEFLPYLGTVVPKVVVVTPLINGELDFRPDHAYRIVKQNNVSKLKQL